MILDIYIRTYYKDLEWLKLCLRSISKFVTGHRKIIICIPEGQQHLIEVWNLTQEKIITCEAHKNDYIFQQVSKLLSYKETDAEYILFVDSDVVFLNPTSVNEYFKDGKPIIFETKWEDAGDAICWKEPTEKILGFQTETEKMRRMPLLYRRDTLEEIDKKFNVISFADLDRLSEFNLVGSYAKVNESEKYYFWNTHENPDLPEMKSRQYWSWGGCTQEVKKEIEELLK